MVRFHCESDSLSLVSVSAGTREGGGNTVCTVHEMKVKLMCVHTATQCPFPLPIKCTNYLFLENVCRPTLNYYFFYEIFTLWDMGCDWSS